MQHHLVIWRQPRARTVLKRHAETLDPSLLDWLRGTSAVDRGWDDVDYRDVLRQPRLDDE